MKSSSSIYNIDENLLNSEVLNIISSIEAKWKKINLIDTSVYNEVDLLIPISSFKTSKLENNLLFNDKVIKVKSTSGFLDQGILNIDKEYIFYNAAGMSLINLERYELATMPRHFLGYRFELLYSWDSMSS